MIKCEGYNQDRAIEDINYCLDNAHSQACISLDKDNDKMFIRNPHFYLNSSDNVREACRDNINVGDSVLTVGGSGDYLFEAVFNGAKKVVNFDINSIQYYVICLKMWAIQELNYKDYLNFIINFSDDYLHFRIIKEVIKKHKDEASYPFWEEFAKARRMEQVATNQLLSNPFIKASVGLCSFKVEPWEMKYAILSEVGPYIMPEKFIAFRLVQCAKADKDCFSYILSEENYNKVKQSINDVDISYVESNITELGEHLGDEKFDSIFISNIPFYLTEGTIVETVNNVLLPMLNDGGKVSTYYQGMRISWFRDVINVPGFKISAKEFDCSSEMFKLNIVGVSNSLLSHKRIVTGGGTVILRDIPTYGGATESKVKTDVLSLIKK